MTAFTESAVEDAALGWPESLGWAVKHGPEIALGGAAAEGDGYGQVVPEERLWRPFAGPNPEPPGERLEDA